MALPTSLMFNHHTSPGSSILQRDPGGFKEMQMMLKGEPKFGFIGYYVFRQLQRIPVQFFQTSAGRMAWLDGSRVETRLMTVITPEMEAHELGTFKSVMDSYRTEAKALFNNMRLWQECLDHGAGLLLLFQAMHTMRVHGYMPDQALASAMQSTLELRRSEHEAAYEMSQFLGNAELLQNPERVVTIRPPTEQGYFSLA